MKFVITLDRDEDGLWIAECPAIPGCISQGETKDEATVNIHEAILGCLEVRAELGMALNVETRLIEVAVASLSVPDHKELAKGTLRGLLRSAGMTAEKFIDLLREPSLGGITHGLAEFSVVSKTG